MITTKKTNQSKKVKKASKILSNEVKNKTRKIKKSPNNLLNLMFLSLITIWVLGSSFFYFNPMNSQKEYTNSSYINFNNVPSDWFNSLKIPEKYKSTIDDNIYELVD